MSDFNKNNYNVFEWSLESKITWRTALNGRTVKKERL